MLMPVRFPPGIYSDTTTYAAGAKWVAGDGVRFYDEFPQSVGGWERYQAHFTAHDTIHGMIQWNTAALETFTGYGCETFYYVVTDTTVYDTTPFEYTITPTGISTRSGYALLTVDFDVNPVPDVGAVVVLAGFASVGGIPAGAINGESVVYDVLGSQVTVVVGVPATADGSHAVGSATISGRVPFATITYGGSLGYGETGYGLIGYGGANNTTTATQATYLWSHDRFGDFLIYNPRGGKVFVWQPATPGDRAQSLEDFGATDMPIAANFVLMADTSRQLIVFGTNDTMSAVFDPMLIRWADTESLTQWTPAITNAAGSLKCSDGSQIVCAVRTRQQILVFTDTALYGLQYIGAPEVFGLRPLANNISIIGPSAAVADDDVVYWMGLNGFYRFDGAVQRMPCPISNSVYNALNASYGSTSVAGVNKGFNEIWFSYPTGDAVIPTATAIYNTRTNAWSPFAIGRSAWVGGNLEGKPLAATGTAAAKHEVGNVDGLNDSGFPTYIMSGPVELVNDAGSGERFIFASKVIPDVAFGGADDTVTIVLTTKHDPGDVNLTPSTDGGDTVAVSASVHTPQIDVRIRGRQLHFAVVGDQGNSSWKLGVPRIQIRPDGRR